MEKSNFQIGLEMFGFSPEYVEWLCELQNVEYVPEGLIEEYYSNKAQQDAE